MDLRRRIFKLETVAAARGLQERPWLTLTELWDEPGVFSEEPQSYQRQWRERSEPPTRYTRDDFPELEKRHRLILVCWDSAREPVTDQCIRLQWAE